MGRSVPKSTVIDRQDRINIRVCLIAFSYAARSARLASADTSWRTVVPSGRSNIQAPALLGYVSGAESGTKLRHEHLTWRFRLDRFSDGSISRVASSVDHGCRKPYQPSGGLCYRCPLRHILVFVGAEHIWLACDCHVDRLDHDAVHPTSGPAGHARDPRETWRTSESDSRGPNRIGFDRRTRTGGHRENPQPRAAWGRGSLACGSSSPIAPPVPTW